MSQSVQEERLLDQRFIVGPVMKPGPEELDGVGLFLNVEAANFLATLLGQGTSHKTPIEGLYDALIESLGGEIGHGGPNRRSWRSFFDGAICSEIDRELEPIRQALHHVEEGL